jgi:single-stranded DNA-binding protein
MALSKGIIGVVGLGVHGSNMAALAAAAGYTVIAWDRLAENVVENALKGDRVVVHGRLEQRDWTTDAGETRTAWEITAEDIGLSLRLSPSRSGAGETAKAPVEQPMPEQGRATVQAARQDHAIAHRHGARTRA